MDGPAVDGAEGTWGIYRKGRRFKKPRFHRTIRHLGISVPATGFSILGTVISVLGTAKPRCRMGLMPCWAGRTAEGDGGENGVGNLAATDCRTRHRWGGEKRSTETGKDGKMASLPVLLKGLF